MSLNYVQQIDDLVAVNRVLISVWDKTGLAEFARALQTINPALKIYSTGGTFKALQEALGAAATGCLAQVAEYTGQPEMQGGLVKTLDFKIYLGLLSETYNPAHAADLARLNAQTLDMVVVNLYPFPEVVRRAGVTPEEARAHIDIGGPCMLRAAAKNFLRVAPVCSPSAYQKVLDELRANGGKISLRARFNLAQAAFAHTADYDRHIAAYFQQCDFAALKKVYRFS